MQNNTKQILPVNNHNYSEYFVRLTKEFLANPDSNSQFQKELDFFVGYSNKYGHGNTLLEIGCGVGRTLVFLAKEGYKCFGIDFDPMQIKFAEEIKNELGVKNITFLTTNHVDEVFQGREFNIVISNDLVEHLPEKELIKYFEQVHSLLDEKGIFLIHSKPLKYTYLLKKKFIFFVLIFFFLPNNLFNLYLKLLDYTVPRIYKFFTKRNLQDTWQDLPPGHCNPPDDEIIRTLLENSGFIVEEINTYHSGTHKYSKVFRKILKSKKLNTSINIYCTKQESKHSFRVIK